MVSAQGDAFYKKAKPPLDAIYEVDKKVITKLANTESCVNMVYQKKMWKKS